MMPDAVPRAEYPLPILLPSVPAVAVGMRQAAWVSADGEVELVPLRAAAERLRHDTPLVCHARAVHRRLGGDRFPAFDLLELFAFVRPACFCLPTPRGLAVALDLPAPRDLEAEAMGLIEAARVLLETVRDRDPDEDRTDPAGIAALMGQGGWPWARFVLRALAAPEDGAGQRPRTAIAVWNRLREWSAEAPEPPPGNKPVEPDEARSRLADLLARGGHPTEPRPQQADYASAVCPAFAPRTNKDSPNLVLAEAGTGVGKTLGYLAPASLWAEKNKAPVWISTYTRNLQHQIDGELERLFADPLVKARRVVVRKGRENYLCLLNLEEAVRQLSLVPREAVALGLLARWVAATRDGDLQGGDFPGWLVDLLGAGITLGLADRRGECLFAACDHYDRCFVEKSVRRARRADIVIANHALVMAQAAMAGGEDGALPTRYVFDEGHHVFDAADAAFAGHLTAREAAELRRWLLGAEESRRSRARGLRRRIEDLLGDDDDLHALLDQVQTAAHALPGEGWPGRLVGETPRGPAERFLGLVRHQVYARAQAPDSPYSLETETHPVADGLVEAADGLAVALSRLADPLNRLAEALAAKLDDEAGDLDTEQRRRIDAIARGLKRRAVMTLGPWIAMLDSLKTETPPAFVDWFGVDRHEGREADAGFYRHHVDPSAPFAAVVAGPAHGMVITSATLTDGSGDPSNDWRAAEARTGAVHLKQRAIRAEVPSPFAYAEHTRVFIVTDVRKDDPDQVAAAFRELFLAAGGGALGLFTNIGRLRLVHQRIAEPLDAAGLPLYAQHVDGLGVNTLIEIFRAEEPSCLLGTDAVRDGVDVPGRSLRLIVFDRVPWPKPSILHKARRERFGGRGWDDTVVRLRLKQAFGRLVRRADDQGVFVLLDPMMPSRLFGAFPDGVFPARVGLAEAVTETRAFLQGAT